MTPQPYRLAIGLALATVAGLVGLMLLEGWWQAPCLALALVPALLGLRGLVLAQQSAQGS